VRTFHLLKAVAVLIALVRFKKLLRLPRLELKLLALSIMILHNCCQYELIKASHVSAADLRKF
jgi:hypothetical protein